MAGTIGSVRRKALLIPANEGTHSFGMKVIYGFIPDMIDSMSRDSNPRLI